MMKKIKSLKIKRIIFSHLYDMIKLKIAQYNKNIQNTMNINLMNYKKFCSKYIIYDNNGIGREYNRFNNNLEFEGEFLNGQRNGKGKEYYDNGNIKFEGEFLNGQRNGKGKEYNENDNIKFEGEYLKGKKNGKGKEYDQYGKIIFEGEYLNDNKIKGKIYNCKNEIYEYNGNGFIKRL